MSWKLTQIFRFQIGKNLSLGKIVKLRFSIKKIIIYSVVFIIKLQRFGMLILLWPKVNISMTKCTIIPCLGTRDCYNGLCYKQGLLYFVFVPFSHLKSINYCGIAMLMYLLELTDSSISLLLEKKHLKQQYNLPVSLVLVKSKQKLSG